jgi:hypothetical protein
MPCRHPHNKKASSNFSKSRAQSTTNTNEENIIMMSITPSGVNDALFSCIDAGCGSSIYENSDDETCMSETATEDGRTSAKKAAEKETQIRYDLSEVKRNERYKQHLKSDSNSGGEDENESGERAVRRHRIRRFQKNDASRVDDMLRRVTSMNVKYIETASTATSSSTIDSFDLEDTTRAFQLGTQ